MGTNLGLAVKGSVFGFETEAAVVFAGGKRIVRGTLYTQGKSAADLIKTAIGGDSALTSSAAVPKGNFTAEFIHLDGSTAVALQSSGLNAGFISGHNWLFLAAINTSALENGTDFEQYVAKVAEFVSIERATLLLKSANSENGDILKKLCGEEIFLVPPNNYKDYQFIAGAEFDLAKSTLGKCLNKLTDKNKMLLWVGGSPSDKSFAASFVSEEINTKLCIIKDFHLGVKLQGKSFFCEAGGEFTLKLNSGYIKFNLSGAVSNTSFFLSAYSSKETKLYLNDTLYFSDLALSIGISGTSLSFSFGMMGRLTSPKISIFAAFVLSFPQPRIKLLTAAICPKSGTLTVADIVKEIADIKTSAVDFLDCLGIEDFDLPNSQINTSEIKEKDKTYFKENDKNSDYIYTTQKNLRNYRVYENGSKVSLPCQVYVCTESVTLGNYDCTQGFFICGVLTLFGIKIKFLFQTEKGKSLTAFVHISQIQLGTFVSLTKSSKGNSNSENQLALYSDLVKNEGSDNGPTFYLNVDKEKKEVNLYLDVRLKLWFLTEIDALVIIRQKRVYIDASISFLGFSAILKVDADYGSFSSAKFAFSITLDSSDFLGYLKAAQDALKNAAQAVSNSIASAKQKIDEAQNSVNRLNRQIADCDMHIRDCSNACSRAKWYQLWIKIAKAAEIIYWGTIKAGLYVAIGVATAALQVAKAVLTGVGKVVENVLKAAATIIEAATNLLWIKSVMLGLDTSKKSINAELKLIVMGKERTFNGSFDYSVIEKGFRAIIESFIKGKLDSSQKEIMATVNSGENEYVPSGGNSTNANSEPCDTPPDIYEDFVRQLELNKTEYLKDFGLKKREHLKDLESKTREYLGLCKIEYLKYLESKEAEYLEYLEPDKMKLLNELESKKTEYLKELELKKAECLKELELKKAECLKELKELGFWGWFNPKRIKLSNELKELKSKEVEYLKELESKKTEYLEYLKVKKAEYLKDFESRKAEYLKDFESRKAEYLKDFVSEEMKLLEELEAERAEHLKELEARKIQLEMYLRTLELEKVGKSKEVKLLEELESKRARYLKDLGDLILEENEYLKGIEPREIELLNNLESKKAEYLKDIESKEKRRLEDLNNSKMEDLNRLRNLNNSKMEDLNRLRNYKDSEDLDMQYSQRLGYLKIMKYIKRCSKEDLTLLENMELSLIEGWEPGKLKKEKILKKSGSDSEYFESYKKLYTRYLVSYSGNYLHNDLMEYRRELESYKQEYLNDLESKKKEYLENLESEEKEYLESEKKEFLKDLEYLKYFGAEKREKKETIDLEQLQKDSENLNVSLNPMDSFFLDAHSGYVDVYGEEEPGGREAAGTLCALRTHHETNQKQYMGVFDRDYADSLSILTEEAKKKNANSRGLISDEFLDKLVSMVNGFASANEKRAGGANYENILESFDRRVRESAMRRGGRAGVIYAEKPDEEYADMLSQRAETLFSEMGQTEIGDEAKAAIAQALYDFRNPESREKEERPD